VERFGPETVFATYRVRSGHERAFLDLLARHWPALDRLGLVTGPRALVFQANDAAGGPVFVEVFSWRDAAAVQTAHSHPEVRAIWGAMEPLVESRDGRPPWEFPHYHPVL
jgi:quinol monooxygenase YgiN